MQLGTPQLRVLISAAELAKRVGRSKDWVLLHTRSQEIPSVALGNAYVYDEKSLEAAQALVKPWRDQRPVG